MIRVNLIADAGRAPIRGAGKARRGGEAAGATAAATGEIRRAGSLTTAVAMIGCLAGAVGWLAFDYVRTERELGQVRQEVALQQAQLARLNRLRSEVATFEQQKAAIDRRIQLITGLEANRRESQELLEFIAQTVDGTPSLWLTGVTRKGEALNIEGRAGSIDAVARFIGELKRAGHFTDIEMKTTEQQPNRPVTTFQFKLTANYQANGAGPGAKSGG